MRRSLVAFAVLLAVGRFTSHLPLIQAAPVLVAVAVALAAAVIRQHRCSPVRGDALEWTDEHEAQLAAHNARKAHPALVED